MPPTPAAPSPLPALGRNHLAFVRGYLSGLDLRDLADRYLEPGMDLRRVRSRLRWLRDELAAAARRHGRPGDARLLTLDLRALSVGRANPTPSLDEFRARVDPDGVFSQAELTAWMVSEYAGASDRRSRRNQRLRERQMAALRWIETLVVTDPKPTDNVALWLPEGLAGHLMRASLGTLAALVRGINEGGNRWWAAVPGIGPRGAQRVQTWIEQHSSDLGLTLAERVGVPHRLHVAALQARAASRRPDDQAIRPIEFVSATSMSTLAAPAPLLTAPPPAVPVPAAPVPAAPVPAAPDPTAGDAAPPHEAPAGFAGRGPSEGRSPFSTDHDATLAWLETHANAGNTYRAYRMHAERLLLWCRTDRHAGFSTLTPDDARAYLAFLADPQPREHWVGPRVGERSDPHWRPFRRPASPTGIAQARAALRTLFGWLGCTGYLTGNPWHAAPTPAAASRAIRDANPRSLSEPQWLRLRESLARLPWDEAGLRLRLAMGLCHAAGLRAGELLGARTGDLQRFLPVGSGKEVLRLSLSGASGRRGPRTVLVADGVASVLGRYLVARGLPADPLRCPPDTRLIAPSSAHWASRRPGDLDASTLYRAFKRQFARAAEACERAGDHQTARAIGAASALWLRQGFGQAAIERGVPLAALRQALGAASLASLDRFAPADPAPTDPTLFAFVQARGDLG